ncbi:MAG: hypothetical protein ACRDGJ_09015, partial [Candidatus Limnocylindria bacterium]
VAERALAERRWLVMPRPARQGDTASRARYDVAYPIQVSGRLLGVVALDIVPRQEPDLQRVLRQLQWGASWLEVLTLRENLAIATTVRERLQTVLDPGLPDLPAPPGRHQLAGRRPARARDGGPR